jgi:hypothetical protein
MQKKETENKYNLYGSFQINVTFLISYFILNQGICFARCIYNSFNIVLV